MNSLTRYTVDPVYSSYSIYDIKSDKIQAIVDVANSLDIYIKNAISFGNDDNDIKMIKGCGIGVAVSNSTECLLKEADYVCDSNNNDVPAKWIEHNCLL